MKSDKQIIQEAKDRYKDVIKDIDLTKKVFSNYMTSKHCRISTYTELVMNVSSGRNASIIDYDVLETEYLNYKSDSE